jgi:hypothetical protein
MLEEGVEVGRGLRCREWREGEQQGQRGREGGEGKHRTGGGGPEPCAAHRDAGGGAQGLELRPGVCPQSGGDRWRQCVNNLGEHVGVEAVGDLRHRLLVELPQEDAAEDLADTFFALML